jgi:hypothetical protein
MGLVHHHGSHLAELRVADLTLTQVRYAAGTRHSEHAHERACFCLTISGGFDENFNTQDFDPYAGKPEFTVSSYVELTKTSPLK